MDLKDIRIATSFSELKEISRFRYSIYLEHGYIKPSLSTSLDDIYDNINISNNFYIKTDKIIASYRTTIDSPLGLPTDEYHLFSDIRSAYKTASGSFTCVDPTFRDKKLASLLLNFSEELLKLNGYQVITGAANPDVLSFYVKNGWIVVGEEMYCLSKDRKFIPVIYPLDNIKLYVGD